MIKESPDFKHFRLAMESFIGRGKPHNQSTLAAASGVGRSVINEALRKKKPAGRAAQEKIARAVGMTLADFLALGQKLDLEQNREQRSTEGETASAYGHYLNRDDSERLIAFVSRWLEAEGPERTAWRLGLDQDKIQGWVNGTQLATKSDLLEIAAALRLEPDDILNDTRPSTLNVTGPVPLIGLAACHQVEWHKILYNGNNVSSAPIQLTGNKVFSVVAIGDSMVPALIGPGQVAYCDGEVVPAIGDAVYVGRKDDYGSLKVFLGWSEEHPGDALVTIRSRLEPKRWILLRGWRSPAPDDPKQYQEPYTLAVADDMIAVLATVIFVKRRA